MLVLATLFPDAARPALGRFVEQQTLSLAKQPGVEVRVVVPQGRLPWPAAGRSVHLPAAEEWKGLRVYRPAYTSWPFALRRFTPGSIAAHVAPVLRGLREAFPFDVIDAEMFWPDGPAAIALGRELHVPVSIKARGSDINYWGQRSPTRAMILAAAREADGLLAVSDALRRTMESMGMPRDKIRVSYTGCDLDLFAIGDRAAGRSALGLSGPALLMVGNLVPLKGHALVLETLRELPGATLLVAGDGPEGAALRELARSLGVEDRARFLGAQPQQALPSLYNAADVMVLPSLAEGLANAWVESLACGTPIVVTDVGGAREVLSHPHAGMIVARNPAAIAEGIRSVLRRKDVDREGLRNSVAHFTWAANGEGMAAHLRALVTARGAATAPAR